jgi:hypothetical protein
MDTIKCSTNILDYYTPAEETTIAYTPLLKESKKFKGIINPDNQELLSVVSHKYKLVTNEELIEKLLTTLDKVDCKYYIEPSHSFVSNKRMRLQLKFPELTLHDSESEIPFSLFIHNSYDQTEGIRIIAGAIRAICANGMIFGKVMQKFYHKHFQSVDVEKVSRTFNTIYNTLPEVQARITALQRIDAFELDRDIYVKTKKIMGEDFLKENGLEHEPAINLSAWQLYNLMTYYVSHHISVLQRANYQTKMSKLFNL